MQAWVKKELWPHRNEWEDTYWPTEAMKRAGELGFLGLCFPEEYGGQGGDYFYSLVRAECMSYSGSGGTNMGFASRPTWSCRRSTCSAPRSRSSATSTRAI